MPRFRPPQSEFQDASHAGANVYLSTKLEDFLQEVEQSGYLVTSIAYVPHVHGSAMLRTRDDENHIAPFYLVTLSGPSGIMAI